MFGKHALAFRLLLVFVAFEFTVGVFVGKHVLGMPDWQIFRLADLRPILPASLLVPCAWLGYVTYAIVRRRMERPASLLFRFVRFNRAWLVRGTILFALFLPMSRAFSIIKSSIPDLIPFYADPSLIAFDRLLFAGLDGWQVSHAIIGDSGTVFLDRVYFLWFTFTALISGWICYSRNARFQMQGSFAVNLTWTLLGAYGATMLSSVGPIFVGDYYPVRDFDPLVAEIMRLDREHGLVAVNSIDFLREHAGSGRFGAGISAMPSMHVALTMLGLIAVFDRGLNPLIKASTVLFAVLIFVGSVHLGWHYLSDGLVSAVLVWAIWRLSGRLVDGLVRLKDRTNPEIVEV